MDAKFHLPRNAPKLALGLRPHLLGDTELSILRDLMVRSLAHPSRQSTAEWAPSIPVHPNLRLVITPHDSDRTQCTLTLTELSSDPDARLFDLTLTFALETDADGLVVKALPIRYANFITRVWFPKRDSDLLDPILRDFSISWLRDIKSLGYLDTPVRTDVLPELFRAGA